MFASIVKAIAVAAVISAGALATTAATSAPAQAQASIEFRFGNGPSHHYRHAPRYARDYCDPRRALNKASQMGVRRAHIVRQAPRRVAVAGYSRGGPVRVVFANQRGCPVIGYR